MQLCLLESPTPGVTSKPRVHRVELGEGAWIDIGQRWLEGQGQVFEHLLATTTWHQGNRRMYDRRVDVPRRTACIPDDGPGHPVLDRAARTLGQRYGQPLPAISLAHYRDGRDSVAFHGDQVLREWEEALVAIVSLGEPRSFQLRPAGGGPSLTIPVGWGDLLVMGGTCQRLFEHGVPKTRHAGPRIAVMFRPQRLDM